MSNIEGIIVDGVRYDRVKSKDNVEDAVGIRVTRYTGKRDDGLLISEIVHEEGAAINSYPK